MSDLPNPADVLNKTGNVVVEQLIAELGDKIVEPADTLGERRFADWGQMPSGEVLALARPRTTAELSAIMKICHEAGQRVVIQGGLTGLAAAGTARDGEIAISLERMRAIEETDRVSATMTVEAGCTLQAVQEAAVEAGYYFPLDLGARGTATIGGVLATNAGGNRVIKYGMAREHVLGVEAVLADGTIISGLHKMLKNNSGYDLKNLLIGSEGTLGIITRVVLRLAAHPKTVSTAWCGLADFDSVTTFLRRAQAELPAGVSAFEVMWPSYVNFVSSNFPELRNPLKGKHAFHVLLESEGTDMDGQAERFETFLGEMFEVGLVKDAAIAMSDSDAIDFWNLRDAPGEFPRLIPNMIAFDISFAVRDLATAASRITEGVAKMYPGALALVYGHLGDGNIHLICDVPGATADDVAGVEGFVYNVVSDLNGSVSAEHGIGMKKKKVLPRCRSQSEIGAMRAIKRALDPKDILGSGRLF